MISTRKWLKKGVKCCFSRMELHHTLQRVHQGGLIPMPSSECCTLLAHLTSIWLSLSGTHSRSLFTTTTTSPLPWMNLKMPLEKHETKLLWWILINTSIKWRIRLGQCWKQKAVIQGFKVYPNGHLMLLNTFCCYYWLKIHVVWCWCRDLKCLHNTIKRDQTQNSNYRMFLVATSIVQEHDSHIIWLIKHNNQQNQWLISFFHYKNCWQQNLSNE